MNKNIHEISTSFMNKVFWPLVKKHNNSTLQYGSKINHLVKVSHADLTDKVQAMTALVLWIWKSTEVAAGLEWRARVFTWTHF